MCNCNDRVLIRVAISIVTIGFRYWPTSVIDYFYPKISIISATLVKIALGRYALFFRRRGRCGFQRFPPARRRPYVMAAF